MSWITKMKSAAKAVGNAVVFTNNLYIGACNAAEEKICKAVKAEHDNFDDCTEATVKTGAKATAKAAVVTGSAVKKATITTGSTIKKTAKATPGVVKAAPGATKDAVCKAGSFIGAETVKIPERISKATTKTAKAITKGAIVGAWKGITQ